jgi:CheY-like chemotaxis protein
MNGPTLRILLVEDDGDSAETLAVLLRIYGHEVDVARDGPTALRLAAAAPPDVALLDLDLPGGMDGYEVARRLREQEADKLPLLIAVTGYGQEEDRRRSAEAGIHLHLLKPVDGEALNRLLQRFQAVIAR